jgi:hypothetical protein
METLRIALQDLAQLIIDNAAKLHTDWGTPVPEKEVALFNSLRRLDDLITGYPETEVGDVRFEDCHLFFSFSFLFCFFVICAASHLGCMGEVGDRFCECGGRLDGSDGGDCDDCIHFFSTPYQTAFRLFK